MMYIAEVRQTYARCWANEQYNNIVLLLTDQSELSELIYNGRFPTINHC